MPLKSGRGRPLLDWDMTPLLDWDMTPLLDWDMTPLLDWDPRRPLDWDPRRPLDWDPRRPLDWDPRPLDWEPRRPLDWDPRPLDWDPRPLLDCGGGRACFLFGPGGPVARGTWKVAPEFCTVPANGFLYNCYCQSLLCAIFKQKPTERKLTSVPDP
jgi:hypothetical protein